MKRITIDELKRMQKAKDFVLLDVRTKHEFDEFHVEGSVLIPYNELEKRHPDMGAKKDDRIVCICRSGNRTRIACKTLEKLGYTDVTEVENGLLDW